jgi:predicted SprT family Zn-dependent metalloprotease
MRGGRPRAGGVRISVALSFVLPDVATLQLMFAQFNYAYFDGEIPSHELAYNNRFSNVAGRITYKPPKIEFSPKHLRGKPDQLRETLLHEMIHAWLFARGENPGHTGTFKRKMRELGLSSIYHDLGSAPPLNESPKRYILRCERCRREVLRKRKPAPATRCAYCRRPIAVFEVVETREIVLARASRPAAAPR